MMLELEKYWTTPTDIECTKDEFYQLVPLLNKMILNLSLKEHPWRENHWENISKHIQTIGYVHMNKGFFTINRQNPNLLQAKSFLISNPEVVDNYEIY